LNWHFPFKFLPTPGAGLFRDFLPPLHICKSFFQSFFQSVPGWAHDRNLHLPGGAELPLCPEFWAAQQRRPTANVKIFVMHPPGFFRAEKVFRCLFVRPSLFLPDDKTPPPSFPVF
jgi:hypothetical protein